MSGKNKDKLNSQSGVTLLLAVLIMSGITLMALGIGAFAIQEIRASRAGTLTEPAISAAETAGEQGLWAIKRNNSLPLCPLSNSTPGQNLGPNTLVNSCESFKAATLNLKANTPLVFYLYDPKDINGDIDLQGEKNCPGQPASSNPAGFLYNSMSVAYKSGTNNVNVAVSRIDGTFVANQSIAPGSAPQTIAIPTVSLCSEGRLKVILDPGVADAAVVVDTFKADGTELGMPDFPTVDATGCSSKTPVSDCNSTTQELYTRRIQVEVPQ